MNDIGVGAVTKKALWEQEEFNEWHQVSYRESGKGW